MVKETSKRSLEEVLLENAHLRKRIAELEALHKGSQKHRSVVPKGQWALTCDEHGKIIEASDSVCQITGYRFDEIQGKTPGEVWKSGKMSRSFYEDLWIKLKQGKPFHEIFINRTKEGEPFIVEQEISKVIELDDEGNECIRFVAQGAELGSTEQMQHGLRYLALVDPLTELPNRTLFHDLVSRSIAKCKKLDQRLALLMVDIDRFVFVNKRFGVEIGDQILRQVGQRLQNIVSESGIVARLGSDEFAIVLEDADSLEDVVLFTEEVRYDIGRPFRIAEREILLAVSGGVAIYPDDATHTQALVAHASMALSKARKLGHSDCLFFREGMNNEAVDFLSLKEGLHTAQRDDEFEIHYQPYFSIENGQMVGMEALARWRSKSLGFVSPARFIPVLEDTGLIHQVGRTFIHKICTQLALWKTKGHCVPIAVNLSASQFSDSTLADILMEIVTETGVQPSDLTLEITETTFMDDIELTKVILDSLKEHGFRIAIDDFGTGYSSLSYLKRLPVDMVKIDLSFIRDIDRSVEDASIVEAVISMARSLDLKTVAEGVERQSHLDVLKRLGCDIGQGYLWSRPLRSDVLERYLFSLNDR